jgi:magnesium-transporting ATPase (P-type)
MLFAGTTFLRGRATGLVVATGQATEIGRIAEILAHGTDKPLPLLRQLEVFSRRLGWATVLLIAVIAAAQALQGLPLITVFLVAIALAVAAIPEGLPVAIAVALAFATRRMQHRKVIVRALPAVEGLGACTLIASDKTGTLTKNELTVTTIVPIEAGMPAPAITAASDSALEGGARLDGLLQRQGKRLEDAPFAALLRLAESATICNEGRLQVTERGQERLGDTVDTAFLDFAFKLGLDLDDLQNPSRQASQIPYEPERRFAAVIRRTARDDPSAPQATIHVKGALETLLPMCGNLTSDAAILAAQDELATAGQRVLAVARGEISDSVEDAEPEDFLQNLQLLGIVGLIDPLRPEVPEAAARCREAGISLRMITGDHPATAFAIARQIGIAERAEEVIESRELQDYRESEADFDSLIAGKTVFARVEPLQKLDIVRALQRKGEVVAVTGDGVNDAPALKAADIGVAMGRGGTDVARGAADLILTDDNLASIVAGVEEGRIAYDNIRKLVYLLIATGLGEIVLFILAVVFAYPVPLFAVQLLWLNLVTNGIQHIALALEKGEEGILQRKPRPPREQIFEKRMISQVLLAGVYMGGMCFVAYAWFLKQGMPLDQARNLVLLLMVLFENAHALNARSERYSIFRLRLSANWFLLVAVIGAQGLHIAALFLPGLSDILQAQPVAFLDWLVVAGLAASLILVMEIYKQATARNHP